MEPKPCHNEGEAENNTSDSVHLLVIASQYILVVHAMIRMGDIGKYERIILIPEIADSSSGIIAGTAKWSEKRILIHTLTGV